MSEAQEEVVGAIEPDKPTDAFERFWNVFPRRRRQGKQAAWKVWKKRNLEAISERIIQDVITRSSKHDDWTKKDGEYVPMPSTYLNGSRWEDEIITDKKPYRGLTAAPPAGPSVDNRPLYMEQSRVQGYAEMVRRWEARNPPGLPLLHGRRVDPDYCREVPGFEDFKRRIGEWCRANPKSLWPEDIARFVEIERAKVKK